ncbi:hypothetical protein C8F01DRAFT_1088513 [Mycena amicta]|nr:hypothetical protein C8F01DRAFT_1088513 [Mycena amicta]
MPQSTQPELFGMCLALCSPLLADFCWRLAEGRALQGLAQGRAHERLGHIEDCRRCSHALGAPLAGELPPVKQPPVPHTPRSPLRPQFSIPRFQIRSSQRWGKEPGWVVTRKSRL